MEIALLMLHHTPYKLHMNMVHLSHPKISDVVQEHAELNEASLYVYSCSLVNSVLMMHIQRISFSQSLTKHKHTKLWMIYLDMIDILQRFIKVERTWNSICNA